MEARYVVTEKSRPDRSADVALLMEGLHGWKEVLGFHLDRTGSGASVRFE